MKFIPVYKPDLSGNELKYVTDCIESEWISSLGEYVGRFERDFASLCEVEHAISLANGTVALHLALLLFGIGPGDEVIVPSLTFVATANAVRYVGAEPVFVDLDPQTWTLDINKTEQKITSRTRAVIPVHLYGHPVDMDPLSEVANEHGLHIIEDAAEAHGAKYKDRVVGGLGDVGCFSFYGNKTITTGEGGMLTTNDDQLAEKARFLKDHGMDKERHYWHTEVGYNYRMTNLQAAVGLAQVERFDRIFARKRELAVMYHEKLIDCPGIELQPEAHWAKSSFWMNSIILTEDYPLSRDAMRESLLEQGIDTRPFFIPLHQLPPYLDSNPDFPISDRLSERGLNIPSYPTLKDVEISRICGAIMELSGE